MYKDKGYTANSCRLSLELRVRDVELLPAQRAILDLKFFLLYAVKTSLANAYMSPMQTRHVL